MNGLSSMDCYLPERRVDWHVKKNMAACVAVARRNRQTEDSRCGSNGAGDTDRIARSGAVAGSVAGDARRRGHLRPPPAAPRGVEDCPFGVALAIRSVRLKPRLRRAPGAAAARADTRTRATRTSCGYAPASPRCAAPSRTGWAVCRAQVWRRGRPTTRSARCGRSCRSRWTGWRTP